MSDNILASFGIRKWVKVTDPRLGGLVQLSPATLHVSCNSCNHGGMDATESQALITRNVKILMAVRQIGDQKALAARLGWPESKMSRALNGARKWAIEDIFSLARVFNLEPGKMLGNITVELTDHLAASSGGGPVTGSGTDWYLTPSSPRRAREAVVIEFPGRYRPVSHTG